MTQAVQTMTRNLPRFVCLESLYIFPICPSLFFQCPSCILFWSIFLYLVILVLYGQSSIKQIGKTSIPSLCRKMTTLKLHLWLFKQWQETCLDLYAWNCYIISYLSKFISSVPLLYFFWSMHPSSPKKKRISLSFNTRIRSMIWLQGASRRNQYHWLVGYCFIFSITGFKIMKLVVVINKVKWWSIPRFWT